MTSHPWIRIGVACASLLAPLPAARAILFLGTGDPAYHVSAPEGDLAGSGWQWEGRWNGLLGTAVAPGLFITAGHAGGRVGQGFQYRGRSYVAVASYVVPDVDVRVWRVAGTFPDFAPPYEGSTEAGLGIVLVGAGTRRGDPVEVGGRLQGWLWGAGDGVQRWGTNTVSEVVAVDEAAPAPGDLIVCTFDAEAGSGEASVSGGDSGGGWFLRDGDAWKLAGVGVGVEALFRRSPEGPSFFAALFDRRGLLEQASDHSWVLNEGDEATPSHAFAVRVAGLASWIAAVQAGGITPETSLAVEAAPTVAGPYAPEAEARLDAVNGRFLVPIRDGTRFFRLRSAPALGIRPANTSAGELELRFAP